jgi:hypothetical protein
VNDLLSTLLILFALHYAGAELRYRATEGRAVVR